MNTEQNTHEYVIDKLIKRFECYSLNVLIPPPVFTKMNGRVVEYDESRKILKVIFPIYPEYLNPFGYMQGGMIAAAIDNTFGPLSMLVAPPNYTRQLEIKYRKPIHPSMRMITVIGQCTKSNKRQLFLTAGVFDEFQNELAIAKALHWVID
jgi:acyl-coenzyme A thioesterase PaaI-like protein